MKTLIELVLVGKDETYIEKKFASDYRFLPQGKEVHINPRRSQVLNLTEELVLSDHGLRMENGDALYVAEAARGFKWLRAKLLWPENKNAEVWVKLG